MPEIGIGEPQKILTPDQIQTFQRYYPEGAISPAQFDTLPKRAKALIIGKARQFTREPFDPQQLSGLFDVTHPDGTNTYAAVHQKKLDTNGETDICIYAADIGQDNTPLGYGEVVRNISPDIGTAYYNKPFIGYILTEDGHRGQGLGTRRYITLNALSQMIHHLPLYSSDLISDEARSVWENLVRDGKATSYLDGLKTRYVFNQFED